MTPTIDVANPILTAMRPLFHQSQATIRVALAVVDAAAAARAAAAAAAAPSATSPACASPRFLQPVAMGVLLGQGWHVYSDNLSRGRPNSC